MRSHRLRQFFSLPQPARRPGPAVTASGFLSLPAALVPGMTADRLAFQQWVYRVALEQSQAVVRPSLPERDVLGVWN